MTALSVSTEMNLNDLCQPLGVVPYTNTGAETGSLVSSSDLSLPLGPINCFSPNFIRLLACFFFAYYKPY